MEKNTVQCEQCKQRKENSNKLKEAIRETIEGFFLVAVRFAGIGLLIGGIMSALLIRVRTPFIAGFSTFISLCIIVGVLLIFAEPKYELEKKILQ